MAFLPRLWWGRLGNTCADEAATARALPQPKRARPAHVNRPPYGPSVLGVRTGKSTCQSHSTDPAAYGLMLRTRQSPDRLSSLIGLPTGHSSCHSRWGGAGGIPEDAIPRKTSPVENDRSAASLERRPRPKPGDSSRSTQAARRSYGARRILCHSTLEDCPSGHASVPPTPNRFAERPRGLLSRLGRRPAQGRKDASRRTHAPVLLTR